MATLSSRPRLAVVLFNLGGPDSLKAVRPFLFNLFRDPAIIPLPALLRLPIAALIAVTRTRLAQASYAHMGGASPLRPETEAQAKALQAQLASQFPDREIKVFIAMRYWRPFTSEAARAVKAFAPDDVVLLPLYPQFSTTTTGSSLKLWRKTYRGRGRTHAVCCYFDEPGWIDGVVERIRQVHVAAGQAQGLRLLFSAHGLPEKIIQGGDPYQSQVERTCAAVMSRLGPKPDGGPWDWQVCYQSRVGPMKWIGPSTPDAIEAAGREGKGVLVVPIAFVSEHVETLVELDRDYAELAQKVGCPTYLRAPAVGVEPVFIAGLARLVAAGLDSRLETLPGCGTCDGRWSACPQRGGSQAA